MANYPPQGGYPENPGFGGYGPQTPNQGGQNEVTAGGYSQPAQGPGPQGWGPTSQGGWNQGNQPQSGGGAQSGFSGPEYAQSQGGYGFPPGGQYGGPGPGGGYPPLGDYGQQPPNKSNSTKIIAIVAAIVAVTLIGFAVYWLGFRTDANTADPSPVSTSQPTSAAPQPVPTSPLPVPNPAPTPLEPVPSTAGAGLPWPKAFGEWELSDTSSGTAFAYLKKGAGLDMLMGGFIESQSAEQAMGFITKKSKPLGKHVCGDFSGSPACGVNYKGGTVWIATMNDDATAAQISKYLEQLMAALG